MTDRGLRETCRAGLWLAVALFVVGSLPYAFAWLTTPPALVYTGLMFDVPDHAQYWSWVTASRAGLFISNTMTPEPNAPIFINPMMWLLARVQGVFGLSFAALLQVWRGLAVIVLGLAIAGGFRALVPAPGVRRTAVWVAIAGAGFGWMLVVAKKVLGTADVPFPHDLYTVEPNTFFATFAYPYLALAQGLVLAVLAAAWRVHARGGGVATTVAVVASMALALSHAYDLLTIYAVLGVFWLRELVRGRRVPVRLTTVGMLIGVASGPIAWYYRNLTANDPLWQAILVQYANAGVWTPPHGHLVILMGLPLVLAIIALPAAWRSDDARAYLATWAIVGLGLIYVPVVFQIKLLTGWQFPLAILAAYAWHDTAWPWLARRLPGGWRAPARQSIVTTAVLVVLVVPTNLYLFAWRFVELRRHERPYYLHEDEMAALAWLAARAGPDDVVLAPIDLGQFVPNYGETRAYLAHWAMTARFFERRDAVARFYAPATTDAERAALLERDGVTLVLQPAPAGSAAEFDPAASPIFEPVFVRPRATVYRYRAVAAPNRPLLQP